MSFLCKLTNSWTEMTRKIEPLIQTNTSILRQSTRYKTYREVNRIDNL